MADAPHHLAERVGQGKGDGQGEPDVENVGQTGWVLQGVRQVNVEETAAVGAQLHDGTHEAGRAAGDGLGDTVSASWNVTVPARVSTAP